MKPQSSIHLRGWEKALVTGGILLFCLGIRLFYIGSYGSDLPFWDQWDAEALYLYAPWLEGTFQAADIFFPHNEHRIALSKLLGLALLWGNGQWDAQLQMTVNALIHGGLIAMFLIAFQRHLSRAHVIVLGAAVVLYSILPFGWENALWGFQSQMYLVILLSLGGLWLLTLSHCNSWKWWGGVVVLALSLFSMGISLLAGITLVVYALAARYWFRETETLRWSLLVVGCAAIAAAVSLLSPVPAHESLQQTTIGGVVVHLLRYLSWPLPELPGIGVLFWLPVLIKAWHGRGKGLDNADRLFWPLVLFVLGFIAVAAYARTGDSDQIPHRYLDIVALSTLVQIWAWLDWLLKYKPVKLGVAARVHGAMIYLFLILAGLCQITYHNLIHDLPLRREFSEIQEERVAKYLLTDDPLLLHEAPPMHIPYPNSQGLKRMLDNPLIRKILPPSVRQSPWAVEFVQQEGDFPEGMEEPDVPYISTYKREATQWETSQAEVGQRWLYAKVAGYPHAEGVSLEVVQNGQSKRILFHRDFPSHHRLRRIGERWFPFYLPMVPGTEVSIRIEDHAQDHGDWLALTAPVEIGTGSVWVRGILRNSLFIAMAGVLCCALALYLPLFRVLCGKLAKQADCFCQSGQ